MLNSFKCYVLFAIIFLRHLVWILLTDIIHIKIKYYINIIQANIIQLRHHKFILIIKYQIFYLIIKTKN